MDDAQDALLTVRAVGPATDGGKIPLSELSRLAGGLQATLERLALSINEQRVAPGRRARRIVDAVKLDVVGFGRGSAVLRLARNGQLSLDDDDVLRESLQTLVDGVAALVRDPSGGLPRHFTPAVIGGLRSLAGAITTGNMSSIDFRLADSSGFTVDTVLRDALRHVRPSYNEEEATIVGRLHMGDFSPAALRCRIDTYAGSVSCDFPSELRDDVLDAMDEMVMAHGIAELQPDGAMIRVLRISDLQIVPSARTRSLEFLVAEQGIRPIGPDENLSTGAPIDDFAEFLEAVRSAREAEA